VNAFASGVLHALVVGAAAALGLLGWRFVRWVDEGRKEQLRQQGKVGLFSPERWKGNRR